MTVNLKVNNAFTPSWQLTAGYQMSHCGPYNSYQIVQ